MCQYGEMVGGAGEGSCYVGAAGRRGLEGG